MVLAQCCDVCGDKYLRDISKFCAKCGEKRMEQGVVEDEDVLEVEEEGNMRGPPARIALQEKTVNTLSYLQVFAPPTCQEKNKVYGKRALLFAEMGIQHRIMLDNYEQVKKWVVDAQESGRLLQGAFNLEEQGMQERLRQLIKEKCDTLQEIKLGRKNHKWDEREIYKYLKQHFKYLRRKQRKLEKLTENDGNEGQELNEVVPDNPVEEDRHLLLLETVETVATTSEAPEIEKEPLHNVEVDETFLLVVLSLPIVDVMKKHLKKIMDDLNTRVTPKPFRAGYRKWTKDKQLREVARYYRQQCLESQGP